MAAKDYYKLLGVSQTATEKEIKTAYRKLARKHHPDVNPSDRRAEEKFKDIAEAYDTLSDGLKRSAYDRERRTETVRPASGRPSNAAGPRSRTRQKDAFTGTDSLGSIFDGLFSGKNTPFGRVSDVKKDTPPPPEPVQILEITLEEAFHGGVRRRKIPLDSPCLDCRGTGRADIPRVGLRADPTPCKACHGSGRHQETEEVEVTIPMGIEEGARLRLRGKGVVGSEGQRGDLLLTIRLQKHPQFEVAGSDLTCEVILPYTVAALGGEVKVETLTGSKKLPIPAGMQCGQKMRLAGQGLPGWQNRPSGDLFARLKVAIPKDLSSREQALLRELAQIRKDPI